MPDELMNSKYLPPIYGHPVFIARGIYKRYAGYYTGHPADLFPPDYADLGAEVVSLSGGPAVVLDRIEELKKQDKIELACQLAEWLIEAEPGFKPGWEAYGMLFKKRAEGEFNMQARGAWNNAVRRALAALEEMEKG
jgi:alkyl sulfatase BDS1-like metallo-beta-lactamase superfamily hydrolase